MEKRSKSEDEVSQELSPNIFQSNHIHRLFPIPEKELKNNVEQLIEKISNLNSNDLESEEEEEKEEEWLENVTEKQQKLKYLSIGIWNEELKMVELNVGKRKWWHQQGIPVKKQKLPFIFPEEAVFQVECENLEIRKDDVPLSLQRCFFELLEKNNQIPLEYYLVYTHLRRFGYNIFPFHVHEALKQKTSDLSFQDKEKVSPSVYILPTYVVYLPGIFNRNSINPTFYLFIQKYQQS